MKQPLEHQFECPHCGASISMLLDPSVPNQDYVEDCEVCCRPLRVAVTFEEERAGEPAIVSFTVTDDS